MSLIKRFGPSFFPGTYSARIFPLKIIETLRFFWGCSMEPWVGVKGFMIYPLAECPHNSKDK